MIGKRQSTPELVALWVFVVVPFIALIAAVPLAWGWGLSWLDVGLAVAGYVVTGLGVTVGFHRHFTHGAFKARRWLRVGLAVAGSASVEGQPIQWVATHRRHHAYSDRDGDPHSPWRFGDNITGLAKGMVWAHRGWLLERDLTNRRRFAPDLLADPDSAAAVDRLFPLIAIASLIVPAAAGGLITWTWQGTLSALFWAGLVRMALLHHVTWSINSVCHVLGERPFRTRKGDRAANFWPLAILSFGESWHNSHHADPSCARHGVLPGQLDASARVIRWLELLGWVSKVRWPTPQRLERKRVAAAA